MAQNDKQQRDLYESERNFRLLVEGVADCALYMLDPTGIVTSWNIGGQRIKGYAPEEILGRHFSRFYTETDRGNGKPARALTIAKEQGRYEEEGWRVRKDGTFFWASVVIDPIHEDGKLVGFAKITRDITERRDTQLKLEQMQNQLAESQKLDALGQLTGGVAHDFNNLLMVITGSIHTLKKGIGDDARMQRAVTAIETATRRGAALTSQLLTFARRQSVNPEPVTIDVAELETALVNLVINARDAMPGGGTITIGAHNMTIPEGGDAGDYVGISVTDAGTGIAPDVLHKIFDPFFTTKPIGKGTGLGLSQVHGFAYQAGGTVRIESELGKGTTVTILLPRDWSSSRPSDRSEIAEAGGSGTVLLVEDNPDVASASASLLEQLGYTVRRVADAEAAVLDVERDSVDLVLSDIVMPGKMDGLGLARRLKEIRPNLPVLLATGYSDAAANARGEFSIIRKPYEIHQLSQAIAKLQR
jgi:PAS domain S-box-containing protein